MNILRCTTALNTNQFNCRMLARLKWVQETLGGLAWNRLERCFRLKWDRRGPFIKMVNPAKAGDL